MQIKFKMKLKIKNETTNNNKNIAKVSYTNIKFLFFLVLIQNACDVKIFKSNFSKNSKMTRFIAAIFGHWLF